MIANSEVFSEYSDYYDFLYADKDYLAETNYISSLIGRFGLTKSSILELGSGTGKHGKLLGDLGYKVTGVERSSAMAKKAVLTSNFNLIVGEVEKIKLLNKFDCVIALFHVVSYFLKNSDVLSLFRNTYEHLHENGLFIFDVWYAPCVHNLRPEIRL